MLTVDTPVAISIGMRVSPTWKDDRVGKIDDIIGWEPE
jgi:uncharacterized OB-fold protein